MADSYSIQVIEDIEKFNKLKDEWNILWETIQNPVPYQSWEWHRNWIETHHLEEILFILTARNIYGKLVGIAPFYSIKIPFSFSDKIICFISQEASNYVDFIAGREDIEGIIKCFLASIERSDKIVGIYMKIADPTVSINLSEKVIANFDWYKTEIFPYTKRLIIHLTEDYEDYLQRLSRKMRQEIRSARKKLQSNYATKFTFSRGDVLSEKCLNILFDLNKQRWGKVMVPLQEIYKGYYHEINQNKMLVIFILSINGKPVAALSCILVNDTIYSEWAGFDYELFKDDIGKAFYSYVFEWAINNGYKKFDFSSGEEQYKLRFDPVLYNKYKLLFLRSKLASISFELSKKMQRWFRLSTWEAFK